MKTKLLMINLLLVGALLVAGCAPRVRVGALQNESQSVELGEAGPTRVDIVFGAGDLHVTGGADKLLEADFTYNVARLKPEVKYRNGRLSVRQPGTSGLPDLRGITSYRNEWDLRLYDDVPMDLNVNVGGGSGDLHLAGLSLTGLDVSLGAGDYTVDLSGEWARDLKVNIDVGAAILDLRLPSEVGVRVDIDSGPHTVDTRGLKRNGDAYTNDAYGHTDVTLRIDIDAGIGNINLEVEEQASMFD
jgi:hypothetical protein